MLAVVAAAITIAKMVVRLPRLTKLFTSFASSRQFHLKTTTHTLTHKHGRFLKEGGPEILVEQTPTHREQGAPASAMFLGRDHLAIWELRSLYLRLEKMPSTFHENQSAETFDRIFQ